MHGGAGQVRGILAEHTMETFATRLNAQVRVDKFDTHTHTHTHTQRERERERERESERVREQPIGDRDSESERGTKHDFIARGAYV